MAHLSATSNGWHDLSGDLLIVWAQPELHGVIRRDDAETTPFVAATLGRSARQPNG